MKTKYALIIFIIGILLNFVGALLKIMHWPFANVIFIVSTAMEVVGGILLLYKLLTNPKLKDFMNT